MRVRARARSLTRTVIRTKEFRAEFKPCSVVSVEAEVSRNRLLLKCDDFMMVWHVILIIMVIS
jgi:hypothetical protein